MADDLLSSAVDKVILIGDVGVGKTSIFTRFRTGNFESSADQKIAEFQKKWTVNGRDLSMTMFDTAGMERHMSTIPHTYFRGAMMLVVVYSIDETDSFDSLDSWLGNAKSARAAAGEDPIVIVLVGNKVDLAESSRNVSQARARELADYYEIPSDLVFEISAKDNIKVQEMFNTIASKIKPDTSEPGKDKKPAPSSTNKKCC